MSKLADLVQYITIKLHLFAVPTKDQFQENWSRIRINLVTYDKYRDCNMLQNNFRCLTISSFHDEMKHFFEFVLHKKD
jgi:hypothetical protein